MIYLTNKLLSIGLPKKRGCDDKAMQYFDGEVKVKPERQHSSSQVFSSVKNSAKSFKNTGRLLNLTQHLRMFSKKASNLFFYALLNFVIWCAPSLCSVPHFCARWAIRNMVIACWAATHTLAETLPHVVRLPVTPLILYSSFKVLVNELKAFCALHTAVNEEEQLTSVILLQWVLNSLVTASLCP